MSNFYIKQDSVSLYVQVGWNSKTVFRPVGVSQFKKGDVVSAYASRAKNYAACGVGKKAGYERGVYDEYWYPFVDISDDLIAHNVRLGHHIWYKLTPECLKNKCPIIRHNAKHPAIMTFKTCKWFLDGVQYTSTYDFCVARGDCELPRRNLRGFLA